MVLPVNLATDDVIDEVWTDAVVNNIASTRMLFGAAAATTTSGAIESASVNTTNVPAMPLATVLSIAVSLAMTATVLADTYNIFVKVGGVTIWQGRIQTVTATNIASPYSAVIPYALAAETAAVVTVTLQRVSGTGTVAVPGVQNGNAVVVQSVPVP